MAGDVVKVTSSFPGVGSSPSPSGFCLVPGRGEQVGAFSHPSLASLKNVPYIPTSDFLVRLFWWLGLV